MTESRSEVAFGGQAGVGETDYKGQEGTFWGKRNILCVDYGWSSFPEYTHLSKLIELSVFMGAFYCI